MQVESYPEEKRRRNEGCKFGALFIYQEGRNTLHHVLSLNSHAAAAIHLVGSFVCCVHSICRRRLGCPYACLLHPEARWNVVSQSGRCGKCIGRRCSNKPCGREGRCNNKPCGREGRCMLTNAVGCNHGEPAQGQVRMSRAHSNSQNDRKPRADSVEGSFR